MKCLMVSYRTLPRHQLTLKEDMHLMDDTNPPTNTETIPIGIVPTPTSPTGGTSVMFAIALARPKVYSTTIQIDCGDRTLLNSPDGIWPYHAPVPAGATSIDVQIDTNAVTTSTSVQIRGGSAGADMSNPASWTATTMLTILPP